jgi:hypothetical protein
MKILILMGMITVFISVFFMFFIFDALIRPQTACFISPDHPNCDSSMGMGAMVMGLLMLGLFIVVDVVTIYIIICTADHD